MNYIISLIFFIIPLLTGCATIISGTTQNVHLQAVDARNNQPLKDVSCSIMDGKGVIYTIPTNPGNALIARGHGSLTPHCEKPDFVQKNFGVGEDFNAVTIVNILFWPGFIVDAISGSMHKYPSHITVFMEPEKKHGLYLKIDKG